jgi:hypothetical protein
VLHSVCGLIVFSGKVGGFRVALKAPAVALR